LRLRSRSKSDEKPRAVIRDTAGGYIRVFQSNPRSIFAVKPYFVATPSNQTILADQTAEFVCRVGGDPSPEILWRRSDGKMPIGRAHILEDKSLHIERVNPQDQGTYICEAENGVGTISASATLTVHCEYCNLLPFSPPLSFSLCVRSRSAVKLITRPVYDYRVGDERRGCCRTEDRRNVAHYRRILSPGICILSDVDFCASLGRKSDPVAWKIRTYCRPAPSKRDRGADTIDSSNFTLR